MGVINVLDKHVAELIAAGEVVERPSSVIKELIENSIDAGARAITVEIKNGGTTFMRVTDDGCGISRDDVRVAFLRHATSKVKLETDLDRISTLGFRGEALASISAVSRLHLITRNISEEIGTSYLIEGGEEKSLEDAGCPVGTTFIIRDLFYNIPARAKFLKKDVSEGISVSNVVDKTALSHPEIAFAYIRDGKQVLKTAGDGKLLSAVYSVFGREFASSLIPVDYKLDAITVTGYISKPVSSRANRNMQNFFVNGRYVRTRTAMAALEEAYKGSIMVGKFPSCVLNISLPFETIDVNVHPAKIEIRFVNERPVFDAVYHAVKSSLLKNDSAKQAVFKNNSAFNDIRKFSPFNTGGAVIQREEQKQTSPVTGKNGVSYKPAVSQPKPFDNGKPVADTELHEEDKGNLLFAESEYEPFDLYKNAVKKKPVKYDSWSGVDNPFEDEAKEDGEKPKLPPETPQAVPEASAEKKAQPTAEEYFLVEGHNSQAAFFKPADTQLKYIGELFDTYIIVEKNGSEMLLIDKHAAHERIIYEKLKSEKAGASAQILLAPVTVTLGKTEYDSAINNLEMFAQCSFEVEDFGNSTVIVRSAPQYIDAAEVADCITEMADYIASGKTDIFTEKMDWFYHNVACRSAVKAGNKNSARELMDIVRTLEENPEIRYCPHGRPITISMKKSEIERQFGRG